MKTEQGYTFPAQTGMPDGFREGHPFSVLRRRKLGGEMFLKMRSFRTGAEIEVQEMVGRTIMTIPSGGDTSAIEFGQMEDQLYPHMPEDHRHGYRISYLLTDATREARYAGTPIRTRNLDPKRKIPYGLYFEPPVFTLPDGTETAPPTERSAEDPPIMFVNRQEDVTSVMFVQEDGTVNARDFRNLPRSKRKAIVDYLIDHPDRIESPAIAPGAKIENSPSQFSVQVSNVRADLDALYGGSLFIPQLPFPREGRRRPPPYRNYQLHARILHTNASPAELPAALGIQRPSAVIEQQRRTDIDPSLPTLHVLRGEDFALAVVEQGDFRNTVAIRGKDQLAVFDYLTNHPKTAIVVGELAAATAPGRLPSTFASIVERVQEKIEAGLEKNSLLASTMRSYKSTRTLAANVVDAKPRDIASGDFPYERLNDPRESLSIVATWGSDRAIQMPSLFATALEHIPFGQENAVDAVEICKHLWPDTDPSELNMNTVRSIVPKVIKAIKGKGPEIKTVKDLINSRWVSKYYFDTDNPSFTTVSPKEVRPAGLVGPIQLQEGVPVILQEKAVPEPSPTVPLIDSIPEQTTVETQEPTEVPQNPPIMYVDQHPDHATIVMTYGGQTLKREFKSKLRLDMLKYLTAHAGEEVQNKTSIADIPRLQSVGDQIRRLRQFREDLSKGLPQGVLFEIHNAGRHSWIKLLATVVPGPIPQEILDATPKTIRQPRVTNHHPKQKTVREVEPPPPPPPIEPLPPKGDTSRFTIGADGHSIDIDNTEFADILAFFVEEKPVSRNLEWMGITLERAARTVETTINRGNVTLAEHGLRLQWKPARGGWGLYDNKGQQVSLRQSKIAETE